MPVSLRKKNKFLDDETDFAEWQQVRKWPKTTNIFIDC